MKVDHSRVIGLAEYGRLSRTGRKLPFSTACCCRWPLFQQRRRRECTGPCPCTLFAAPCIATTDCYGGSAVLVPGFQRPEAPRLEPKQQFLTNFDRRCQWRVVSLLHANIGFHTRRGTTMRTAFLRIRHTAAPVPNACRWCGREQTDHGLFFARSVGNHYFVAPTPQQRLARMRTRRVTSRGR